ncbi:MAG: efflux RND transporter periplasmic adaptor subunit [Candidatus Uhrbacteria bacterium]
MKFKKPLIIGGIIAVLVIAIGGYFLFKGPAKVEMVTATVKRGTLIQTVEATGELESFDKVELAFGASGTVENILVEVGDEVKAGEVLATLDLNKISASVESARQAAEIARANLAQKKAGSSDETVAVYEAQVASARAALDAAEVALDNAEATGQAAVAEAETSLANAQEDLENTQIGNAEDLIEAYEDLVQVLKNNMIVVRGALSDADEVLGINNSMANDDFEDVLSANDYQALVSAESSYRAAVVNRDRAENAVFVLTLNSEITTIEAAVTLVQTALADSADTLLHTRQVLDATNVNDADFSSSDLSVLKASIDTARNSIQTEEEALSAQLQTISQLEISSASSLDNAENLVDKYEKALTSARVNYDSSVTAARATVATREAGLAEAGASLVQAKAAPRVVDLSALEAAVSQAEANYAQIQAGFADAQILAPIDGRVTIVDVKRGEEISMSAPVITVQTASTKFQIAVDVSEADISKISLDETTKITFDAFGDDREFTGRVGKIDPAEKNIDGVIYYKVTVYLDDVTEAVDWKPGMTADVTILTAQKENVLLVPQRAVLERTDKTKYVRLPNAESFDEQTVTIGTRGDEGMLEIISGLEENQTIIVSIRN